MVVFFSYFLTVLSCLLAVPVFVFFVEIVASLFVRSPGAAFHSKKFLRKSVAILVPAHNESAGLQPTLDSIKQQLVPGDRLLVVADNCTDDTADVAIRAGAEVIIRNDPETPGKGYALDFGVKYLGLDPPEIVIFIDADCKAAEGSIDRLATTCIATNRPVQALYLMGAPDGSPVKYHVAEFAWRVKNWVRPLGLDALGLPCQLMGSGMAFPWGVVRVADLAHGSIVEDMKLGLELAEAGSAPLFCPAAKITSDFPWSNEGADSQRKRWEEGHIGLILATVPHFFYTALAQRNFGLFTLTLDLIVAPLSLLMLMVIGISVIASLAIAFGAGYSALFISVLSLFVLAASIFLAWIKYCRDILPIRKLFSVASYVLGKLPLYRQIFLGGATSHWVRTDRRNSRNP